MDTFDVVIARSRQARVYLDLFRGELLQLPPLEVEQREGIIAILSCLKSGALVIWPMVTIFSFYWAMRGLHHIQSTVLWLELLPD